MWYGITIVTVCIILIALILRFKLKKADDIIDKIFFEELKRRHKL